MGSVVILPICVMGDFVPFPMCVYSLRLVGVALGYAGWVNDIIDHFCPLTCCFWASLVFMFVWNPYFEFSVKFYIDYGASDGSCVNVLR